MLRAVSSLRRRMPLWSRTVIAIVLAGLLWQFGGFYVSHVSPATREAHDDTNHEPVSAVVNEHNTVHTRKTNEVTLTFTEEVIATETLTEAPTKLVSKRGELQTIDSIPRLGARPNTPKELAECLDFGNVTPETPLTQMTPSFIVIGGQKCGTTSMYSYIIQHPRVVGLISPQCANGQQQQQDSAAPMAQRKKTRAVGQKRNRIIGNKEIRFFDNDGNQRNISHYISYFPRIPSQFAENRITGESTPNYIYSPNTATRIKNALPNIKLIAMLRNPVDRAYSHYHHAIVFSERYVGNLTFEDLISTEMAVIESCENARKQSWPEHTECHKREANKRMPGDALRRIIPPGAMPEEQNKSTVTTRATTRSRPIWALQTLHRGIYVEQLREYFANFGPDQLLILKSDDMFKDPPKFMNRIANFLGIPEIDWSNITERKYNFGKRNQIEVVNKETERYAPMKSETHERLVKFFKPYNEELYALLKENNVPFTPWE